MINFLIVARTPSFFDLDLVVSVSASRVPAVRA